MWLVAKKSKEAIDGWVYFKEYNLIDGVEYPINTFMIGEAKVFNNKQDAALVYWNISHFFYDYKIYNYNAIHSYKGETKWN